MELLRKLIPYLLATLILVGLWELVGVLLVAAFGAALPQSVVARSLLTLAALAVVSLATLFIVSWCGLIFHRVHLRLESKLHHHTPCFLKKGKCLDFEWLCEEDETHRNVELLRNKQTDHNC